MAMEVIHFIARKIFRPFAGDAIKSIRMSPISETRSRVSNIFQARFPSERRPRCARSNELCPVNFVGRARWSAPRENAAHSGGVSFYLWRMERGWFSFHDSIFRDKAIVVSGHFGRVGTPPSGSTGAEEGGDKETERDERKTEEGKRACAL